MYLLRAAALEGKNAVEAYNCYKFYLITAQPCEHLNDTLKSDTLTRRR